MRIRFLRRPISWEEHGKGNDMLECIGSCSKPSEIDGRKSYTRWCGEYTTIWVICIFQLTIDSQEQSAGPSLGGPNIPLQIDDFELFFVGVFLGSPNVETQSFCLGKPSKKSPIGDLSFLGSLGVIFSSKTSGWIKLKKRYRSVKLPCIDFWLQVQIQSKPPRPRWAP